MNKTCKKNTKKLQISHKITQKLKDHTISLKKNNINIE